MIYNMANRVRRYRCWGAAVGLTSSSSATAISLWQSLPLLWS